MQLQETLKTKPKKSWGQLYYRGKAITMAGPNEVECMESAITGESDDDDSIAGNVEED